MGAPTIATTHFSFLQMKFNSTCKNNVYPLIATFLKKKIFFMIVVLKNSLLPNIPHFIMVTLYLCSKKL